jgi:hypothetical protein
MPKQERFDAMLPTACNMPDLSGLQSHSPQGTFILNQLIGAGINFPPAMASYRRNIVRLADKAVHDYTDVRKCVLAQISEAQRPHNEMLRGRQIYMFGAIDRLEDCIITVQRLFRYFEKVKSDRIGFPLDRLLRKQLESVEESIRETRNLIEHLDDDIKNERTQEGENTAPALDAETRMISLAGAQLPVGTLARAIRHFHKFAHEFARFRLTAEGNYEPMPKSGPLGGRRRAKEAE